jgi:hypothetical protein
VEVKQWVARQGEVAAGDVEIFESLHVIHVGVTTLPLQLVSGP